MLLLLLPTGVALPVRIESSSPSVIEGQTLDLDCVVAGPSSAIVTWYKRGGSLPTGHQVGHNRVGSTPSAALPLLCDTKVCPQLQVSGSRLRVPHVTAADSGEYVCRASLGTTVREASVIVTVVAASGSSYGKTAFSSTGGDKLVLNRWSQLCPPLQDHQLQVSRSGSRHPRPPWPRDRPWTSTASWLGRDRPLSPGTSVEGPSQPSTR